MWGSSSNIISTRVISPALLAARLYVQRELHPIQVYKLNIQLIKINEIYLEKNMLLP